MSSILGGTLFGILVGMVLVSIYKKNLLAFFGWLSGIVLWSIFIYLIGH